MAGGGREVDPYTLLALAPPVVWTGLAWWWLRSESPRREQTMDDLVTLKRYYQDLHRNVRTGEQVWLDEANARHARVAPQPFQALSSCPKPECDWFGWHEMLEPDPTRERETLDEWYYTEPLEYLVWAERATVRQSGGWKLRRHTTGMDETLLEVVRVCPECETRWGATSSGKVVW